MKVKKILILYGLLISSTNLLCNVLIIDNNQEASRISFEENLAKNDNVFLLDGQSAMPIHYAVASGNRYAMELLLKDQANIEAKDRYQNTPLHYAAANGQLLAVETLLRMGANIDSKNQYENTPLHYAADKGQVNVVKFLLKAGAKIESANQVKATPLHYASEGGQVAAIDVLLESRANINAKTTTNQLPLHGALNFKHIKAISLLLTHDSKLVGFSKIKSLLNIDHKFGVLIVSVLKNDEEAIKKLFSTKLNYDLLNGSDVTGTNALMYAIGRNQQEAVDQLINYSNNFGCLNLFGVNQNGLSALKLAKLNKNVIFLRYIANIKNIMDRLDNTLFDLKFPLPLIDIINQYCYIDYKKENCIINSKEIESSICKVQ